MTNGRSIEASTAGTQSSRSAGLSAGPDAIPQPEAGADVGDERAQVRPGLREPVLDGASTATVAAAAMNTGSPKSGCIPGRRRAIVTAC
jgi:hypothetical protein